jgi:alcohol dehydrogenase class IV
VSRIITGNTHATALQGAEWLEALVKDLKVPGVSDLCGGIPLESAANIAKLTAGASSTKGNPVTLSVEELERILIQSF